MKVLNHRILLRNGPEGDYTVVVSSLPGKQSSYIWRARKHMNKWKKRDFKFDWEDGLSELREKYTSVELQHKVLELRKNEY